MAGLGISALLVGAAGWAAIELARYPINDTLNNTTGGIRGIADVMVGQAESSLHDWLDLTLAAGGVLVMLGVSSGWPRQPAEELKDVRSVGRPASRWPIAGPW